MTKPAPRFLYLDQRILPAEKASISPFDQGLLYGASLFTTFPVLPDGKIPFWPDHQRRLRQGARALGLALPPEFLLQQPPAKVAATLGDLLAKNQFSETGALGRYRLTAGEAGLGLPGNLELSSPREIIDLRPLPPRPSQPLELHRLQTTRDAGEGTPRLKTGSYLNSWLGHRELAARQLPPHGEGLFLNAGGFISEGLINNVFWIRGNRLETPSPDTGCLPGLTRQWVLDFAAAQDLEFAEGQYPLSHLQDHAEALFCTNAVKGLQPVSLLKTAHGRQLKQFSPHHPLLVHLHKAYASARQESLRIFRPPA